MKHLILALFILVSVHGYSQKDNNKGQAAGKNDGEKSGGKMDDLDGGGLGAPSPPPPPGGGAKPVMKKYFIVFLKKGPNRNQDSATAAKIQEGHLKHLKAMGDAGKMDIAGPFEEDGEIRGICIYNVATLEEAKKLAAADPAVKAGRLIVEVHAFYGMPGSRLK